MGSTVEEETEDDENRQGGGVADMVGSHEVTAGGAMREMEQCRKRDGD